MGSEDGKLIWSICANLWDPVTNPSGYVSLGMAENVLMHTELRDFLASRALIDDGAIGLTYGDGPTGSRAAMIALAGFFNDYFHPVINVESEHLMITNGVSSAIEHTAWAIANPGEGILVGRPYYRAFTVDLGLRPGVKMVSVSFGQVDPCTVGCVSKYEEALIASEREGLKIRAILLCHPHNPLGRCYGKTTLVGLMTLCQRYGIHLISDEIYALSVWKNTMDEVDEEAATFTSVLSIDTEDIIAPELVHVLWGTSKDFGANGLRVGVIISQANPNFMDACRTCGMFSYPSSLAENALAQILSDRTFLQSYISTNSERLSSSYAYAVEKLKHYGIEYLPGATATFFLWIDLGSRWQRARDSAVDTEVIFRALLKMKVFLVTGDAVGAEHPGWFRIVFSQRRELVDEAIKRIAEAISTS
ncbi:Nn.00g059010.m01.CDS01 [Neocucurbitaria sp. VM-36]